MPKLCQDWSARSCSSPADHRTVTSMPASGASSWCFRCGRKPSSTWELRSGDAFEHFPCCASARSALVRAWHRILELNYCVRKGFVETSIPCHVVPVGLQNMALDIGGKRLQVEPVVPAVPAVQAWTPHALVCREVSTQAGCSQVLQLPELTDGAS